MQYIAVCNEDAFAAVVSKYGMANPNQKIEASNVEAVLDWAEANCANACILFATCISFWKVFI